MANSVQCPTHGETEETFVCSHLTEGLAGLGFNRNEPSEEDPFPDAWCDDCELIFQAHGGWTTESQKLVEVRMLCSGCYERSRIRNTRTEVSFDDLSQPRWKCGSCEEWHYGPCLNFSHLSPTYWTAENEAANQIEIFLSGSEQLLTNLLTEDICILDSEHYFIRGLIELPIVGTNETFKWGVWGSLKRENFETLLEMNEDPERVNLPPMFSWLSNSIDEYPETLNLKMYAHVQEPGLRPMFELEPTDHPLSLEYYHGITPERVKDIMMRRLDLPEM